MRIDVYPGVWDDALRRKIDSMGEVRWLDDVDFVEHCHHLIESRGEGVDIFMTNIPNRRMPYARGYIETLGLLGDVTTKGGVPILVLTGMPNAHRLMFCRFASFDRSQEGADQSAISRLEDFRARIDSMTAEEWKEVHRQALAYTDRRLENPTTYLPFIEQWMIEGWGIASEEEIAELREMEESMDRRKFFSTPD